MAKNSTCCPEFPEEETITNTTASTMQLQEIPTSSFQFQGYPTDCATTGHSQSHRQAEKRRRDRINAQFARLRKLIPKSEKMDKAALLEKVVQQVKEMKKNASELSKVLTIPTETDDVNVECYTNINEKDNNGTILIKATLCCEDRPDLITDLVRALKGLNLITIGADIACLGGRIKSILLLYYKDNGDIKEGVCNVSAIKQSLMSVLTGLVSWSSSSSCSFRVTSKRQRFFFSSN